MSKHRIKLDIHDEPGGLSVKVLLVRISNGYLAKCGGDAIYFETADEIREDANLALKDALERIEAMKEE